MSDCRRTANHRASRPIRLRGRAGGTVVVRQLSMLLACALLVAGMADEAASQARERSGKEVVEAVCTACHGSGAKGAPKIGDRRVWEDLASQGLTGLTELALKGFRKMPPHGGNPDLTDTEISRAITFMVNQSGGHWIEPASKLALAAPLSGGEVVSAHCARCHESGEGGAPRIGDRAAWLPRARQGFDYLVSSAINGHGPMPSRGEAASLTDAEIRKAVAYMMNGEEVGRRRPAVKPAPGSQSRSQGSDAALGQEGVAGWLRSLWNRIWTRSAARE